MKITITVEVEGERNRKQLWDAEQVFKDAIFDMKGMSIDKTEKKIRGVGCAYEIKIEEDYPQSPCPYCDEPICQC